MGLLVILIDVSYGLTFPVGVGSRSFPPAKPAQKFAFAVNGGS